MTTLEDLPLFQPRPADPLVADFVNALRRSGEWITARQFQESHGWNDRLCRALAEASDGRVISGRWGYKHVEHATQEEIHHFCASMQSQGKKMLRRSLRTRRYAHQVLG